MPSASAYYVPTEEASLTATAGRSLQGLGCTCSCNDTPRRRAMSWYLPGVLSPAQLAGFGDRLPPSLSAAYSYPVDGLGRLGAGAGSGRFNRSVARGIYDLPFIAYPGQGGSALGELPDVTTLLGWFFLGVAGIGVVNYLTGRRRHHRRRR